MHTEMWEHPATQANVATLRRRGVVVLDPAVGRLTGADTGPGRLPEPAEIFAACRAAARGAGRAPSRATCAGGTSSSPPAAPASPSTRCASSATGRPAGRATRWPRPRWPAAPRSTLVAANVALPDPAGVEVVRVVTAAQLRDAVLSGRGRRPADAVVMAAAVADFRPARPAATPRSRRRPASPTPSSWCATPTSWPSSPAPGRAPARSSSASPPRPATPAATCWPTAGPSSPPRAATCSSSTRSASDRGFEGADNAAVILGADGTEVDVPLGPQGGARRPCLGSGRARASAAASERPLDSPRPFPPSPHPA